MGIELTLIYVDPDDLQDSDEFLRLREKSEHGSGYGLFELDTYVDSIYFLLTGSADLPAAWYDRRQFLTKQVRSPIGGELLLVDPFASGTFVRDRNEKLLSVPQVMEVAQVLSVLIRSDNLMSRAKRLYQRHRDQIHRIYSGLPSSHQHILRDLQALSSRIDEDLIDFFLDEFVPFYTEAAAQGRGIITMSEL